MIVTCPACSARYKIDASKLSGKGARITCPRCGHKFVVTPEGKGSAPSPAADWNLRDFNDVSIIWRVRNSMGMVYEFTMLTQLRDFLDTGQVDAGDSLSYDGRAWSPIDTIDDLPAFFADVWAKAERGEVESLSTPSFAAEDEDETDAPTSIMTEDDAMFRALRQQPGQAATMPGASMPSEPLDPADAPTPPPAPSPHDPLATMPAASDLDDDADEELLGDVPDPGMSDHDAPRAPIPPPPPEAAPLEDDEDQATVAPPPDRDDDAAPSVFLEDDSAPAASAAPADSKAPATAPEAPTTAAAKPTEPAAAGPSPVVIVAVVVGVIVVGLAAAAASGVLPLGS